MARSWIIGFGTTVAAALACAAGLAAPSPGGPAPGAPAVASPQALEFFEKQVRPLLSAQCFQCHSGANTSGNLDLTAREPIMTGGALGPAVAPGDPDKSLLIQAIRYDGKLKMPPRGKLTDEQIAVFTEWVKMGAPWPDEKSKVKGQKAKEGAETVQAVKTVASKHWSFQPVRVPKIPTVRNRAWVKNPVDAFVLAKLEAKGLKPNPAADRRTLIRRATFDLTGLPPTQAETDAFLADRSPDAWAKVVDRLLASPAYGERWGRHWLDIVRYADSNGQDWNEVFPNAWRYRDYVIRSFNEDKPYDQFIREQLAGDLLAEEMGKRGNEEMVWTGLSSSGISSFPHFPISSEGRSPISSREELLVATGMLVMGPKLLAQQDRIKLAMDVVDEQIDVTSKAFMGLTVSCARCHDHKFDPIPTKDYYSLAGIFKSTVTLKGTLPRNVRVMYWNERPLAPAEQYAAVQAHEQKVRGMQDAIKKCKDDAEKAKLAAELADLQKSAPPPVPMAMAVAEGRAADCPVHIRGSHDHLGAVAPRGFLSALGGPQRLKDPKQSGRRELADWIASPKNPLTARVLVNRVWLHHFGEGIVRTPDDFGIRGERPTHPELLDYLAATFVGGNGEMGKWGNGGRTGPDISSSPHFPISSRPWSLKGLHRLLMLSSAYQMSSDPNPAAYAKDPENRLVWRMNRRRLEAEAIRDGILAAAGSLDRTPGGTLVQKTAGFPVKEFPVDFDSRRRSVYLPALRVVTYDLMKVFDFAEPSMVIGRRNRTTVATQALVMLNSPFVTTQSQAFADSLLTQPGMDDRQRVEAAYARALGRTATSGEVSRAERFMEEFEAALGDTETDPAKRRAKAWAGFCQTLFASTEFRYLD